MKLDAYCKHCFKRLVYDHLNWKFDKDSPKEVILVANQKWHCKSACAMHADICYIHYIIWAN